MNRPASWQLPCGVSPGTWDYSQDDDIAASYDDYFGDHGLFRLDQTVVHQLTKPGDCVIDLGCGTGRALMPLLARGMHCVAVDLSSAMLSQVQEKAKDVLRRQASPSMKVPAVDSRLLCVRANLVELDCFANDQFDVALCLFSTLGMIRGQQARRDFLQHVGRLLKPGARLVLQVHNYWVRLFDPKGPGSMVKNAVEAILRPDIQIGDRFYPYRGIPDMYLHSFTRREIRHLLHGAGLSVVDWIPLNAQQDQPLAWPAWIPGIRASGWIIVAEKTPAI